MNNYVWSLNNIVKNCKYFLPYHTFATIAVNKTFQNEFIISKKLYEHQIIHSYFENSIHYNDTIFSRIKTYAEVTSEDINKLYITNWSNESADKIFDAIKKLSYSYISGSRLELSLYDSILKACIKQLTILEDQQIKILMQYLIVLNNVLEKTHTYGTFMKELNKECLKRFYPSNTKELLLMSDAFYQLQDKKSDYLFRAIRKLSSKSSKLSAKSLVQFLFYLNLTNIGSALNMFEIEFQLEQHMSDLVISELGIIARSFFLQKRSIKNKILMPLIMKKISENVDNLDSITLASIMKLIRYSDCFHCRNEFQILLKSLHKITPKLSLLCLIHIAHAFGSLHVYDEILTNKIIERVIIQIKIARLKDIERIIYSICTIAPNTNYHDICQILINEIITTYKTSRAHEIKDFPATLVRILTFLTLKNIYIPELIQYIFEPKFMQKVYKNNLKLITNEWLVLYCSIEIEMPYYKKPMLNDNMYKYLTKKFSHNDDIHRKDNIVKLRTEIVFLCKEKLGINIYIDYVLPHYPNREIILGMDKYNNSVDIEPILSAMQTGTIKSVKNDELQNISWKILMILSYHGKILGHDGCSGYVQRQFRQLKAIGYQPILIYECEWNSYTQDQKIKYLKKLIYQENHDDFSII